MQTTHKLKYKPFSIVVAVSPNNGIGFKGQLPWPYIPKEMKHFADVTSSKKFLNYTESELA